MAVGPLGAYRDVARLSDMAPAASSGLGQATKTFQQTMTELGRDAVRTVGQGEQASLEGIAGIKDAHEVVAAMTQAELTIQATVAIRDKLVQSYHEIMRMPV